MSDYKHMTHKFRPVLTLEQIMHLSNLCRANEAGQDQHLSLSCLKVLVPIVAKIEVGAINPAYKLSETHQLKLSESQRRKDYENGHMTPEQEQAYETEILGL